MWHSLTYLAAAKLLNVLSKNVLQFGLFSQRVKVRHMLFYFGEELASDVLIFAAGNQDVCLWLHLSVWTELTQSVLCEQPGLSVYVHLYGQAVVTESVHGQSLSQFLISHGA